MNGSTALVVAFLALALVWAYSRHAFDQWIGLATPHGTIQAGPSIAITHTGNGYGKVQGDHVPETGPRTGATGPVGGVVIYKPTYGPNSPWVISPADLTPWAKASGGYSAEGAVAMLTP